MNTLLTNARIATMNDSFQTIESGYVLISDKTFKQIGEGQPPEEVLQQADVTTDLNGKWVVPGLYNTHGHAAMTLMRGYEDDLPLDRWLKERIWPFEGKLSKEAVAAGRDLAMVEMIKSGTIGFLEMYHLNMDDFAARIEQVGMRALLTRSVIGLCPREEQDAKLNESANFAASWDGAAQNRIHTMLAPHAPYTCPIDYIERIVDKARDLSLPVHMHLAETQKEVDDYYTSFGKHPLDHLAEYKLLEDTEWLFAHAVHLDSPQIALLAQSKSSISHNPMSNLKLGSGIAPVIDFLEAGIPISIGTDGVSANNNLDMWQELRTAVLLQKGLVQRADAISTQQALRMVMSEGASALQTGQKGMIQVGEEADFIVIDHTSPHLQPEAQLHSHLVYAAVGSDVSDVYVQGQCLMKNRELLTLDEEKVRYEVNNQYLSTVRSL
ncbi:amidohydrolase [Alkalihalobacillus sp. FSL W8-0930]